MLQEWLSSYDPHALLPDGKPNDKIVSIIPEEDELKLGQRKEAYDSYEPLDVPDWKTFSVNAGEEVSCMKVVGELLHEVIKQYAFFCLNQVISKYFERRNPKSFRIFSPDELVSNKLDAVLRDSGRNFQWDIASRAKGGRVIEILSEHTCQGMLQGYTLTGRTGLFPSYEAFLGIIHTMMVQYSKFVKMVCFPNYIFNEVVNGHLPGS
jgi:xylulose-5-phosphate/fructose-6-phosphate phosphoketolase